ncbi:MAG: hypothetical protein Q7J69_01695 [Candidatus Omnitrophota bacterium]|nr:hypothetical protein [Candidatus Omnitrophota bacterium]
MNKKRKLQGKSVSDRPADSGKQASYEPPRMTLEGNIRQMIAAIY